MNTHTDTVQIWFTVYGDGALLDASTGSDWWNLRRDDDWEEGAESIGHNTATLYAELPAGVARRVLNYARKGNTDGFSDGYEALDTIRTAAVDTEVIDCEADWKGDGPCFLCGRDHDDDGGSELDEYTDPDGDGEHEHEWGPFEHSHFGGSCRRTCQVPGCDAFTLDGDDDFADFLDGLLTDDIQPAEPTTDTPTANYQGDYWYARGGAGWMVYRDDGQAVWECHSLNALHRWCDQRGISPEYRPTRIVVVR